MARTPGIFVPLDANYLRDPAIRRAGPDAELLYIRALAHAKSCDTDGGILAYDLPVIGVGLKALPRRVEALVREDLWTPTDDGWHIRSWERWNMTRDERVRDKEAKRAGAILTNHKRNHSDKPDPMCQHCEAASLERPLERPLERRKTEGSQREVTDRGKSEGETEAEGSQNAPRAADAAPTAATLIAEWIDRCDERPPARVIGQLSREIRNLLDEGIPYPTVREAVASWHRKSLHPSALASVVHEVRNPRQAEPRAQVSTTDQRVNQALDVARRLAAEEARNHLEIGA